MPESLPGCLASAVPPSTSLSLLERVKARDTGAWQHLVQIYGPLVFQWCRRWDLSPEDAADVFQEVFQAVATQVSAFRRDRPGDTFRGWLWAITRNKVNDHFRDRGRQPRAAGGTEALQRILELPEPPPPDDADGDGPVHRALDLIQSEFEPHNWQAFWRVAVEGRAARDVATELGMTADAVRMAKFRVLRRPRQELAELDSD